MRQYSGMGDAEQSNRRYRFLLAQGGDGLSVAFDLPTQIGYDSDSPWAAGEVGRAGVAIDSLEDIERLFAGIPLHTVSTSLTINGTATILLAMYVAAASRSGCARAQLSGTVQNDILKEYVARGTYIYPLRHSLRLMTDLFAWSGQNLPSWNPISISGYHLREARRSRLPWPTRVPTSPRWTMRGLIANRQRRASHFSLPRTTASSRR
jgi:methylmalonyl-CoA mutase N-terminal domain/subunit